MSKARPPQNEPVLSRGSTSSASAAAARAEKRSFSSVKVRMLLIGEIKMVNFKLGNEM